MNSRRALFLQAVRGPIVLITIGTLFLWQQAHVIDISRTWPLILIVIGILKLFERMAGPVYQTPPGYVPPQPGYQPPSGYPPSSGFPGGGAPR